MAKSKKLEYRYAVGRRRNASARIRLFKGSGRTVVNEKPIEDYFPGVVLKDEWSKPFRVIDAQDLYYATVKVSGGGKMGQLDAVIHGIAKALASENKQDYRSLLKKAGLLTRDARIRERRKIGMGGKARRKKQSPKR
jgi:small subunit ribosomal protein S9